MAETFTPARAPDNASSGSVKFRILKADFGDAYTQRTGDGINTKEADWTLTWTALSVADFNSITAFLDARGGFESFNYTLPGAAAAELFTCEQYTPSYEKGNLRGLTATLKKVYDV